MNPESLVKGDFSWESGQTWYWRPQPTGRLEGVEGCVEVWPGLTHVPSSSVSLFEEIGARERPGPGLTGHQGQEHQDFYGQAVGHINCIPGHDWTCLILTLLLTHIHAQLHYVFN